MAEETPNNDRAASADMGDKVNNVVVGVQNTGGGGAPPNTPVYAEMPPGEFSSAWKRFVKSLRSLVSGVPVERALDPFMPLRDSILDASERDDVVLDLENAWLSLHAPGPVRVSFDAAHLLLMELNAFPSAVELAEAEDKAKTEKSSSKKKLLSLAKTTLDSARDLLDQLPFPAKAILKVLGEVIDMFRGD